MQSVLRTTSALNLVVNCTARKAVSAGSMISLGDFSAPSMDKRVKAWTGALDANCCQKTKAIDLYCGDYWATVRKATELGFHRKAISLFIASAGYGLVRSDEPLAAYSATFSGRNRDAICFESDGGKTVQRWWSHMRTWRRESGRIPSCIADLACFEPDTPLIAVLSSDYFRALYEDLLEARANLSNPDLLILISVGVKNPMELSQNLLPSDARLEHFLGGVRSSLNARLALHVLRHAPEGGLLASRLAPKLATLLDKQPPIRTYNRSKMNDKAVRDFIYSRLSASPSASYTSLLRMLRDIGGACEHKRFRSLFYEVASL